MLNFNFLICSEGVVRGCPRVEEQCVHRSLCPLQSQSVSHPPPEPQSHRLLAAGLSVAVAAAARPGGYTAVHTVLTVNSASLLMMSVGWMLRSYMGFSNVARMFVFSWPA